MIRIAVSFGVVSRRKRSFGKIGVRSSKAFLLLGDNDVYVAPSQIRRFNLKTGDIVCGNKRIKSQGEKFSALLYINTVNGYPPYEASRRKAFEDPDHRIRYVHLVELPGYMLLPDE